MNNGDTPGFTPALSIVVVVSERYDDVKGLFLEYDSAIKKLGQTYEFVYVLDGTFPDVQNALHLLQETHDNLILVQLARRFGEAAGLSAGFAVASGHLLITLPPYHQIDSQYISQLPLSSDSDVVVARRYPRSDSRLNRLQAYLFNKLVGLLTNTSFHDLGCEVRLLRRDVVDELTVYGDQFRFIPIQALQRGFTVEEFPVLQSPEDLSNRVYRPGVYLRRFLDILTIFFLSKFTRKPLRFFGLIGFGIGSFGAILLAYLIAGRIVFALPLADRPLLFISSLLIVLGAQLFAIGLLGELIIFMQSKSKKEYKIKEIVN